VESCGGYEQIERPAVREILERAHLEPDGRIRDIAPGSPHHRRSDVDGSQVERPPGQLPGELAGAAADLQHGGARAVNSRGNQAVSKAVAAVHQGGVAAIQELLVSGQASGEFRDDFDPKVTAMAIRAVVDRVPPLLVVDPGFDVRYYGRELADLFDAATRRVPGSARRDRR
jgi:hypothetical protein